MSRRKNIEAMYEAAHEYGKYPLNLEHILKPEHLMKPTAEQIAAQAAPKKLKDDLDPDVKLRAVESGLFLSVTVKNSS